LKSYLNINHLDLIAQLLDNKNQKTVSCAKTILQDVLHLDNKCDVALWWQNNKKDISLFQLFMSIIVNDKEDIQIRQRAVEQLVSTTQYYPESFNETCLAKLENIACSNSDWRIRVSCYRALCSFVDIFPANRNISSVTTACTQKFLQEKDPRFHEVVFVGAAPVNTLNNEYEHIVSILKDKSLALHSRSFACYALMRLEEAGKIQKKPAALLTLNLLSEMKNIKSDDSRPKRVALIALKNLIGQDKDFGDDFAAWEKAVDAMPEDK